MLSQLCDVMPAWVCGTHCNLGQKRDLGRSQREIADPWRVNSAMDRGHGQEEFGRQLFSGNLVYLDKKWVGPTERRRHRDATGGPVHADR